jgi:hypothetical protein
MRDSIRRIDCYRHRYAREQMLRASRRGAQGMFPPEP